MTNELQAGPTILWDDSEIPDRQRMPAETFDLLQSLRAHVGKDRAISMADLYEKWSGVKVPRDGTGRPTIDVPSWSRHMRKLIDDLRDIWGAPIMSSSHVGYWIIGDDAELAEVVSEFRARGLKSLATAARLKKISLADEVQQIEMELRRTIT